MSEYSEICPECHVPKGTTHQPGCHVYQGIETDNLYFALDDFVNLINMQAKQDVKEKKYQEILTTLGNVPFQTKHYVFECLQKKVNDLYKTNIKTRKERAKIMVDTLKRLEKDIWH